MYQNITLIDGRRKCCAQHKVCCYWLSRETSFPFCHTGASEYDEGGRHLVLFNMWHLVNYFLDLLICSEGKY